MADPQYAGRQALSTRFLVYFSIVYILLIALVGVLITLSARTSLADDLRDDQVRETRLIAASLPAAEEEIASWVEETARLSESRVTIIQSDGVVVADSHADAASMENHATRPEVLEALEGEVGFDSRRSASTGFKQSYVAVPPEDDLIVRTSIAERVIEEDLNSVRRVVIVSAMAVGVLGIAVVAYVARRLARPIVRLTEQTMAAAEGGSAEDLSRSEVRELDMLSLSISEMVEEMQVRVDQAEAARRTLEVVLSAIPQGTVLIESDRVAYANSASQDLLGEIADDLDAITPFQFQELVREVQEGGVRVSLELEHGRPPRLLRGVATPLGDEGSVLLIVIDITERERMASVRRDFVANASHELKTPVSSIVASSEALRIAVEKDQESARRFSRQIEASAMQLNRLVSDLLDLSRLEREAPELAAIDLDMVVTEEVERIRPQAEEKGIEVATSFDSVPVEGSRRDLAIAVRNILENAIRHTPGGGTITVEVQDAIDEAMISVRDTGEGIPTRDLERVFERFYRVDAARSRQSGGTGLGLAIVKHVVEGHRGRVDLESELGVGSTFTITIPKGR